MFDSSDSSKHADLAGQKGTNAKDVTALYSAKSTELEQQNRMQLLCVKVTAHEIYSNRFPYDKSTIGKYTEQPWSSLEAYQTCTIPCYFCQEKFKYPGGFIRK